MKTNNYLHLGIRLGNNGKKHSVFQSQEGEQKKLWFSKGSYIVGGIYSIDTVDDKTYKNFKLIEQITGEPLLKLFAEQRIAINEYEASKKLERMNDNIFDSRLQQLIECCSDLNFQQKCQIADYVKSKIINSKNKKA
jgi:hypothetical protein